MKQPSRQPVNSEPKRQEKLSEREMPTAESLDRDAPRAGESGSSDRPSTSPRWQPLGGEHAENGND